MPKFIIAREVINEAGFEEYHFAEKPYVHRSQHHAEQESRRLARKHEATFAVFRKVATVGVVSEDEPPSSP